jgi:hypothetical protein
LEKEPENGEGIGEIILKSITQVNTSFTTIAVSGIISLNLTPSSSTPFSRQTTAARKVEQRQPRHPAPGYSMYWKPKTETIPPESKKKARISVVFPFAYFHSMNYIIIRIVLYSISI